MGAYSHLHYNAAGKGDTANLMENHRCYCLVLLIFGWLLTTMAVIAMRLSARKKLRRQPRRRLRKWRNWQICTGCKQGKQHLVNICPYDWIYRNKKYVASVGDIIDEKK